MIAVCPNPYRDCGCEISLKVKEMIRELGMECCICPIFAEPGDTVLPKNIEYKMLSQILDNCELVVVIGGDGTILNAARQIHGFNIPIFGINLGTKGFMAHIEADELEYVVKAVKGEYKLSRRMMLEVDYIRGGEIIYTDHALNDVVVHGCGDCINVSAFCGENHLTAFSGDGIIVSTPTGSTGYSMSAGGPIVAPVAENIIVSPICAHMMSARSFVLAPDNVISININKLHDRRATLSVDGNSVMDMVNGDSIVVKRSSHYTLMADLGLRNFYEIAFEKLR